MADKEIINAAGLEDRKYLTINTKIWTKTFSNHSFLTVPSTTLPVFLHSIRKPVCRSAKQIIRLASTGVRRGMGE